MSIDYRVLGEPYHDNALYIEIKPGQSVHRLLFDCGENCLDTVRPADIMAIDHLCFSHFHLDHVAGFDRFIRMNYNRETKPVRIWGPVNAPELIRHRLQSITWDRVENSPGEWVIAGVSEEQIRMHSLYTRDEFSKIHRREDLPAKSTIYSSEDYSIDATILSHRSPSVAYRVTESSEFVIDKTGMDEMGLPGGPWAAQVKDFSVEAGAEVQIGDRSYTIGELRDKLLTEEQGQSIAYATDYVQDPATIDALTEMIRGCNVFVSEATYNSRDADLAAKHYHMTAGQAAAIARDAEVDELVLLHFSKRYQEAGYESILADARKIFPETTIPMQWSD